ncbi:hypothetical protein [Flagellimonas beolgyonensis]|uniref:hypothetical protein n=1 Tax=Flagellimonas beolgyonensis TaxID=864064 RepID=UPI003D64FA7E
MLRYKKMWIVLGILIGIGVFWYLILYRKINPDNYFVKKLDTIPFTHVYVNDYAGSLKITPGIGERYYYKSAGKVRISMDFEYSLFDDEYAFKIDGDNNFVLIQLSNNQSFVLGRVVKKSIQEFHSTDYYEIELPKKHKAIYQFTEGIFPFYVPVQFTMMTSGGMKYSSEYLTEIISSKGDTLRLYYNYGHIPEGKPTGIY